MVLSSYGQENWRRGCECMARWPKLFMGWNCSFVWCDTAVFWQTYHSFNCDMLGCGSVGVGCNGSVGLAVEDTVGSSCRGLSGSLLQGGEIGCIDFNEFGLWLESLFSLVSSLTENSVSVTGEILPCIFMCFLSELGCVYVFSHPRTRQQYGLSLVWTWECFFLSELLANLLSHPGNSHGNGFSPTKTKWH